MNYNPKHNPKIRFNEFNDEWKMQPLTSLSRPTKGEQPSKILSLGKYYYLNGGQNISGWYNEYNTNENTISISEGGESAGFVSFNKEKFWAGCHLYTLLNIKSNIDNLFLFHVLKFYQPSLQNAKVGGAIPNIQKQDLENLYIYFPKLVEQQKIASLFTNLDNLIENTSIKLQKLKDIKQSLLSNMFVDDTHTHTESLELDLKNLKKNGK